MADVGHLLCVASGTERWIINQSLHIALQILWLHIESGRSWSTPIYANKQPVLLQTAMFMTIPAGAGVPVPAQVTFPGQTQVQGI